MASDKVIKYFNKKFGEYNYRCRLQDFSDEQIKEIITNHKPATWWELEDILMASTSDKEVHAHLKGFDSYKERQEMVAHIKRLQNECAGGM